MLRHVIVRNMVTGFFLCFVALTGYAEVLRINDDKIVFHTQTDADLKNFSQTVETLLKEKKEKTVANHADAKKIKRGLKEIDQLITVALKTSAPADRQNVVQQLLETVAAVNNSQLSPIPTHIDQIQIFYLLLQDLHRPVGRGEHPATNLAAGPGDDSSKLDPITTSFWQRPANIPEEDLYHGFGRNKSPSVTDEIWNYAAPKESYGMNPGLEVAAGKKELKVKFGEVSSEPFAARIYSALGFHADPTDHATEIKIRYTRRIFTEFHSRREMKMRFTLLWFIPLHSVGVQNHYDPFAYITYAVLKDGQRWTGQKLKRELFHDPERDHPEDEAANFRPEIETNIDYLITVPTNVQEKETTVKSIGPWDPEQLDHANRREVRAEGLLAAWLGFYDIRIDNTRVKIVHENNQTELLHYYSDLGSGLGQTDGFFLNHGEQPNVFPWTFTQPPLWQGRGHMALPLRIQGYRPSVYNSAFAAMTIDDARWMARLIAQLTEQQIIDALIGSGYDNAEARLYLEKLISRRDRMILDLGLASEIPLLRPGGINRHFSYDPTSDGPVLNLAKGIKAATSDRRVVSGQIVSGFFDKSCCH